MDTDNPVIKLCVEGMKAENEGRSEDARKLFEQAWAAHQDDFDACIAAHYLARHQDNPQAVFEWNQEALSRASAVDENRVQSFYPSLYLIMGHSYETLGDLIEARRHYEMAAERLSNIPDGAYKNVVQNGISSGFKRMELIKK